MTEPTTTSWRFWQRLTVAGRLWLALFAVILALASLLGFAGVRSTRIQRVADQMTADMDARQQAAERWLSLASLNAVRARAGVIGGDPAVDAAFKPDIDKAATQIGALVKQIEAMDLGAEGKASMARIAGAGAALQAALGKAREARSAGDAQGAAAALQQKVDPALGAYVDELQKFAALQATAKLAVQASLADERRLTLYISNAVVAAILLGLVGGAVVLIRSIQQPLAQAIDAARRIAGGDLSRRISVQRHDEFGQLLGALDDMVTHLRGIVGEVRMGVESVSTASSEIANGNQDLSARTEQTASSLQQTASSMEVLTGAVSNSADTARQDNQLALSAAESAERGGEVVAQVVSNMAEITDSSRKISDIIGVIDGIAFQTNILALNAAVEAARAGDQGRGFAVVASEVRALAQRSAQAAKEIKSLIGHSVERVESGAQLAEQTGTAMHEIVESVRNVAGMIGQIANAAVDQRDGIGQVNVAVTNLDQMTQQNAALVEESAAAAHSLREQAQRLAEAVSVFNVGR